MHKAGGFTESYIMSDGGRQKIRARERKVLRQVRERGTLSEPENDGNSVMRWRNRPERECLGGKGESLWKPHIPCEGEEKEIDHEES